MEMQSALVGPNISSHYISITFAPLHFKCNNICHNRSGFTVGSPPGVLVRGTHWWIPLKKGQ